MTLGGLPLTEIGPALSSGLCLGAVPLLVLARKLPNLREGISLLVAVSNFALIAWLAAQHQAGATIGATLFEIAPGLSISFRADALGLIFALVASSLWILNTLYSIGYMRAHDEPRQTRFYSCFAVSIGAAMGAAFSANAFALFAFYELLTLCTYPLVVHAETETAKRGAKRYVSYLLGTSIAFQLPALFLVYAMAGTLDFAPGGLMAGADAGAGIQSLAFVLYVFGLAKCGLMPFHGWLPAAMVAPTPVSALLHAVAVVKMGVFSVCRVVLHVFGVEQLSDLGANQVLLLASGFTVICASCIALGQDNLKRRLAYSTISQLSYILLGVALLVPEAIVGGVAHIGAHAVSKITLFFGAGAIYVATHKTRVSELDGLARRMPFTMTAFAIGSLSMIGLPPDRGDDHQGLAHEGGCPCGGVACAHRVRPECLAQCGLLPTDPVASLFQAAARGRADRAPRGPVALRRCALHHGRPHVGPLRMARWLARARTRGGRHDGGRALAWAVTTAPPSALSRTGPRNPGLPSAWRPTSAPRRAVPSGRTWCWAC